MIDDEIPSTSDVDPKDDERRIAEAVRIARGFVDEAAVLDARRSRADRRRQRRLAALVSHPDAAEFTVRLTDEVSRMSVAGRAAHRFAGLVGEADLTAFSRVDRWLLRAGALVAPRLPGLVMPLVHRRLRSEAGGVILPASDPAFADHLAARAGEGIRSNVNVLGEAIVGDGEARRRLAMVIDRLSRPDVDYVSVKISAICPSISVLAFDDTVERVVERLRPLYRVAASSEPAKFVNLDMEEYRDLDLTIAAFRTILDDDEFLGLDAGIVLQAYLPDARASARELATWANERHARGGGRIKIRIVKGANLAMEHAAAELHGWVPAPFATKHEVDANYKAVLDLLAAPEYDDSVRIGLASHNLFDIAWALGLRRDHAAAGRPSRIEFEMLEGMSPSQSEVVRATTSDLLLYSPVVTRDDFAAAIAYLVRRLDENTSPDNFLAHLFDLADDAAVFDAEAQRFAASVRARRSIDDAPRRRQDRRSVEPSHAVTEPFVNAPDTDWTRAANRAWLDQAMGDLGGAAPTVVVSVADVDRAVAISGRGPVRVVGDIARRPRRTARSCGRSVRGRARSGARRHGRRSRQDDRTR